MVILAASYLLPGIHVTNFTQALVTALVLGIINAVIKPILLILTLPITLITLGLFTIIINAVLILLTDAIVPGFSADSFLWAIILAIFLALVNTLLHRRV